VGTWRRRKKAINTKVGQLRGHNERGGATDSSNRRHVQTKRSRRVHWKNRQNLITTLQKLYPQKMQTKGQQKCNREALGDEKQYSETKKGKGEFLWGAKLYKKVLKKGVAAGTIHKTGGTHTLKG